MKGPPQFFLAAGVFWAIATAGAVAQAPRAVAAAPPAAASRPIPRAELPAAAAEARPAPAPAPGSAAVASSAPADYVLSTADTIEIIIYREPELQTRCRIGSDGTVQLPLIRDVKVAGLTVRAARELIRRLYDAEYLVDPQVNLNLIDFAQRSFTIVGQVIKPGIYPMQGGRAISLMEAVGMAGGFTRSANLSKVVVKRSTDGGGEISFRVNAKKQTGDASGSFNIQTGDVINIGESWF